MDDSVEVENSLNQVMSVRLQKVVGEPESVSKKTQSLFGIKKIHLAAMAVLLNVVAMGMVSAFTAPASVDMKRSGSRFINVTNSQITWIASLPGITAILGSLLAGYMSHKWGRKAALMYTSIPYLASWLIIAYAPTIEWIYAGRLLVGFCVGVCSVSVPAYIIEIASIEVRGLLGSCFQLSYTVGILITMSFGIFFRWSWLAIIGGLFTVSAAVLMLFIPESPSWLILKQKHAEAAAAIHFLKGVDADIGREFSAVSDELTNTLQRSFVFHEFKEPQLYKPIALAIGLMFFQQFSGISALMAYTVEIFERAESSLDSAISAAIVAVAQVFATVIGSAIMDRAGRRTLYICSGAFVTIGLIILGVYGLVLEQKLLDSSVYGWIPLVGFVVFVASFSLGYGPIPYLMTPEIVPVHSRSAVLAIAGIFSSFFLFIVTKTFDDLRYFVSDYGVYWVYGFFSFLGCLFCLFCVPETKNLSTAEMQRAFKNDDQTSSPYKEI